MEVADLLGACDQFLACVAQFEPGVLAGDELKATAVALERLRNAAHWLAGQVLEELHQSGAWVEEGSYSAANWLAARTGSDRRELTKLMYTARRLRLIVEAAEPAAAGRLSPSHQRDLAACAEKPAEFVERDAAMLAALAEELPALQFRVAAAKWRSAVDDEVGDPTPDERELARTEPSRLHLSETVFGRWALSGDLAPDDGALLAGFIQAGFERHTRNIRNGDPSYDGFDAAALRGSAFADLLAQAARREPSERSVPDRYRTMILITPEERLTGHIACCDAEIARIVLDQPSGKLDVGNGSPRWLREMRRGITCRDGGCIFPGCDRPPSWCEIHHCREYRKGGSTAVDNGVLLCRHHHVFLHKREWYVEFDEDGIPQVHKPNGDIFTIPQLE